MKNKLDLHSIVIDHCEFNYFYTGAGNDTNGNRRFHIYIIDPDGPAVYETFIKCYTFQIPGRVKNFILENIGIAIPF
jgi:hypothetical protein